jgi:phosphoglycolate phosphatase
MALAPHHPALGDTVPMPTSPVQTVIFDLDGTLTDSRTGILRCLEAALRTYDIPWKGPLDWFIGPPAGPSFARLMPAHSDEERRRVLLHYRTCYAETGWAENALYPGVMALLTIVRLRGLALYVCTSKRIEFARRILDHFALTSFFFGIVGDSATTEHHDKADLLRAVISTYGVDPATAVMVGDREFDMLAARAVGLRSIAVLYGFGSPEELAEAQPDFTCSSVEDLSQLLLQLSSEQRRS